MQNFTLMILSAGFGTRMQNLTRNIPKPQLKINNTTLIKNTINFFEKIGCNRFIINTHYLYKQFNDYLDLNFSDKKIISIYEPEILDTGGGIKNAIKFFDRKNFLVTNCDIFWNGYLIKLFCWHKIIFCCKISWHKRDKLLPFI